MLWTLLSRQRIHEMDFVCIVLASAPGAGLARGSETHSKETNAMAYLKELIERLGKALGIKPKASQASVSPVTAEHVEPVESPVEEPPAVEADSGEASGAPAIVGG